METANTQKPPNRTFAVIDGGINFKPSVQAFSTTQKPKFVGASEAGDSDAAFQRPDRESVRSLDQAVYLFPQQKASGGNGRNGNWSVSF